MKLAVKLVAFVVVGVVILLAIDGYVSVQRETELFDTDMERDALLLGRTLRDVVTHIWRTNGRQPALDLIKGANEEGHLRIRWVWLDAPPGDPFAPFAEKNKLKPVAGGHELSFIARNRSGHAYRYTYVPVVVDERRAAALELSESLLISEQYTRRTIRNACILVGVLVLLSGALAMLLGVRIIGRPLRKVTEKSRRVGTGDLSGPLHLRGHDELEDVAAALNAMCEQLADARERIRIETDQRVAALEQLRHADRLKTVGRLASGVAHELGTPLMVVAARADLIASEELPEKEVAESASIIKSESERMTTIVRQLLDFARRRPSKEGPVDLEQLARRTLGLLGNVARKENKTLLILDNEADAPVVARADAGQIEQVLTNLITNALQATPEGGTIRVGVHRECAEPPAGYMRRATQYACLHVEDDGRGIPEEHIRHVFEPFFTTKDVGKGTGLGLSIAHGIVSDHGGWINVESKPGRGSRFSVYLPEEQTTCTDES